MNSPNEKYICKQDQLFKSIFSKEENSDILEKNNRTNSRNKN